MSKVLSLRVEDDLAAWADEYAKARGVTRQALLEEGLRSFRDDCERGVPEIRAAARRQVELARPYGDEGVGDCPERPDGFGHIWMMGEDMVKACRFCGMLGREFLQAATADRAALFAKLRTPESVKGGKAKR